MQYVGTTLLFNPSPSCRFEDDVQYVGTTRREDAALAPDHDAIQDTRVVLDDFNSDLNLKIFNDGSVATTRTMTKIL